MNNRTYRKMTLEDITLRKEEVLKNIRIQHEAMGNSTQEILAPFMPSTNKEQNALVKKFNTGMMIFDGLVVGVKVFKSFRKMFRRRR